MSYLTLLAPGRTNNYYQVATMGGDEGWVWGNNVRLLPAPAGPAEVFNGCPMEGNASREDYRALNRLKNRVAAPQAGDLNGSITLTAIVASGPCFSARWRLWCWLGGRESKAEASELWFAPMTPRGLTAWLPLAGN